MKLTGFRHKLITRGWCVALAAGVGFIVYFIPTVSAQVLVPTIDSLSPPSTRVGGDTFTLIVNGSNFHNFIIEARLSAAGPDAGPIQQGDIPASVVRWNGQNRPTEFVSETQLRATIFNDDIRITGTARVTVFNPRDNRISNEEIFTIVNPLPRTSGIIPTTIGAGSGAFTLTVNGADFVPTSRVRWNNSDRSTTFGSSGQLRAAILASDIATGGTISITVFTPGPGGGTSNPQTFTITNPVPSISSINPVSRLAGGPDFLLTVNGARFVSSSRVRWNGSDRPTTFVSGTQLTAPILANDITTGGTASVTVISPGPGGGASNPQSFTITNPLPGISSLNPNSAQAGGPAFPLTVNGTGFVSSSRVRWNGSDRLTNFVSSAQLMAEITASDIAMSGTASVTVFNPAPDGGTSNPLTFTIVVLVITTTSPLPDGTVGTAYSQQLVASGGSPPYSWSAGSLPPGLMLNSSTGVISGAPTNPGSFNFTVQVTDVAQRIATKTFDVTVNPPSLTVTTPSPLPTGMEETAYSQQLAATGGTPPYTWVLSAGSLPAGLNLEPSGLIRGTPARPGNFNFTARVTDTDGRATVQAFDLTINPVPALMITTGSPLPAGMLGTAYSRQLAATGGTPPYTWALSAGSLPDGLNLNSGGLISGTPTGSRTFNFTAQVTDNAQRTATRVFDISIDPTLLTIQTGSPLRSGTAGIAYAETLAASGGTPPYTWTLSAGSLPAGLDLNSSGLISGTPASSGTLNFTAQVTDVAQQTAARTFDVTINPAIRISGLPDSANSREQPNGNIVLSNPSQSAIRARIVLTFTPDANLPDDPLIVFSDGSRIIDRVLPAGSTDPSEFDFQAGTVAGVIRISVTLESNGIDITPSPPPIHTVTVSRRPPVITSLSVGARTASSFEVVVVGYSNTRAVAQGIFRFTGRPASNLQTESIPIDLTNDFSTWYAGPDSLQMGGQFRSVTSFTVQGDINTLSSVSVTLTNGQGTSEARSINF
jgi:Putative Ig domain